MLGPEAMAAPPLVQAAFPPDRPQPGEAPKTMMLAGADTHSPSEAEPKKCSPSVRLGLGQTGQAGILSPREERLGNEKQDIHAGQAGVGGLVRAALQGQMKRLS